MKPNGYYVDIFFFFQQLSIALRKRILDSAIKAINSCIYRSNQRFLLTELNETHIARDFINISPATKGEYDDTVLHQFSCPVVFFKRFQIHWRLKPAQVLNSLMTSLQALAISNRKDMLAFSTDFYSKNVLIIVRFEISEENSDINLPKTPSTLIRADSQKWIFLYVHGLSVPGIEITADFVKLVQNKIDSLIQNALSIYLARNFDARLNAADLEFLMPTQAPNNLSSLLLVKEMENPLLLIVLIRQALMLFLQPMIGTDVCEFLKTFYKQQFEQIITDEPDQKK